MNLGTNSEKGITKLFTVKIQVVNILGFQGHKISATTTQLYYYSGESCYRQDVNEWAHGHVPVKIYL